ncbi:STAS-like domain-containing protein [Dyadobacter sp. CY343]|uniref:STAS-like domain-containing protein n=1 Tax=Dyadobacter sp. CY343 TaxID=2907299 RepID=UPI001F1B48CE|nr:STAS-like domain-containing protein [Dyadobacter sp. CY343]MCE7061270.1 STAS-like domain-containing protein [Dyadobacter sp. CY343]
METMTISIKNDFSEYPGLRHCSISDKSGEEFYHQILNREFANVFESGGKLTVDLDDTSGFASSFLDEAFGNLVFDFTLGEVQKRIEIISEDEPVWKSMLQDKTFPQWEERRRKNDRPSVTQIHPSWFRLVDGKLVSRVWEVC